jgi:cytochrome c553
MKKILLTFIAMLFNMSIGYAADAPASAQVCVACHGQNGNSSNPEWPNLAGQKAGYLATQLKAFRDGTRSNPAMAPFVAKLSDGDIANLAAYYAGKKATTSASGDRGLVSAGENLSGYCKACHGMSGQTINTEWPNINGQQAAYLKKQLQAFKSGDRTSARMQPVISHMANKEFEALAAYYSQLNP